MTNNAWNTPDLTSDGKVLIGNGTNSPSANTIIAGTNCTVTSGAGSIQLQFSGTAGWELVGTATPTGSAEVTFTDLSSTYFSYIIVVDKFIPATDGSRLYLQTSTDNGSTYDNGASDYYFKGWTVKNDASLAAHNAFDPSMHLIGSSSVTPGTDTNESSSCITTIHNPSSTGRTRVTGFSMLIDTSGNNHFQSLKCERLASEDVDAIRLYASTGNIEAADIRLYGIRAS